LSRLRTDKKQKRKRKCLPAKAKKQRRAKTLCWGGGGDQPWQVELGDMWKRPYHLFCDHERRQGWGKTWFSWFHEDERGREGSISARKLVIIRTAVVLGLDRKSWRRIRILGLALDQVDNGKQKDGKILRNIFGGTLSGRK